ncbi:MAG: DUF4236 domain-containing protein [Fibrobacterota bacterium]
MRFRKRKQIIPGINLNFSKSGISITGGIPGASVNLGREGAYLNTGIPGTGLYDRKRIGSTASQRSRTPAAPGNHSIPLKKESFHTRDISETTSPELQSLNTTLFSCEEMRKTIYSEYRKTHTRLQVLRGIHFLLKICLIGFFLSRMKKKKRLLRKALVQLQKKCKQAIVSLNFSPGDDIQRSYTRLHTDYNRVCRCKKIWDITAKTTVDKSRARSFSSTNFSKTPVTWHPDSYILISTDVAPLHFSTAQKTHIYLYPAFILIEGSDKKRGLIDLSDVTASFEKITLPEEGIPPADAEKKGHTWARVNKDGSRDKRFTNNYSIPLCEYGMFTLRSSTGLKEAFLFSSSTTAEAFAQSVETYLSLVKSHS